MKLEQGVPRADDLIKPNDVVELLDQERAEFVWRNDDGGYTYRVWPTGDYFSWVTDINKLQAASQRSIWLQPFITAPIFSEIRPGLQGWWVTSKALPGESAFSPRWIGEPATAVLAIATGLRILHDSAPVERCPFVTDRNSIFQRALSTINTGSNWRDAPDDYLYSISDERAKQLLMATLQSTPDLVVCHGDPCSPNTIIGDDGSFVGIVDISELGVFDRWADLAVASWSITWNYGPGWEDLFFHSYGIEPDTDLNDTFRIIWNAGEPLPEPSAHSS